MVVGYSVRSVALGGRASGRAGSDEPAIGAATRAVIVFQVILKVHLLVLAPRENEFAERRRSSIVPRDPSGRQSASIQGVSPWGAAGR